MRGMERAKYRFLEGITSADVAFEAQGRDLSEMFENSAYALENTMISRLERIKRKKTEVLKVGAEDAEQLLYRFLHELVVLKDIKQLVFSSFKVSVGEKGGGYVLESACAGSRVDPRAHGAVVDVKDVSMHRLKVWRSGKGYRAVVVLDV